MINIGKRNIKVEASEFKGKAYVSIREYYEKDGKMLPGRKGINLNLDEWKELLDNIDTIQTEIESL